jgi:hypothetical protein
MSITLDIRPEVQAELSRQASLSGRDLAGYLADLLESTAKVPGPIEENHFGKQLVAVCSMVRGLTADIDFSRDRSEVWRPLELA